MEPCFIFPALQAILGELLRGSETCSTYSSTLCTLSAVLVLSETQVSKEVLGWAKNRPPDRWSKISRKPFACLVRARLKEPRAQEPPSGATVERWPNDSRKRVSKTGGPETGAGPYETEEPESAPTTVIASSTGCRSRPFRYREVPEI